MSDSIPKTKLPKGAQPPRIGAGEKVRKRGGADLQNGWWGRHGTLFLTDERLLFVPTTLDRLLRARRQEMRLDEVLEVERWPMRPGEMPLGGKRPRMLIHTKDCVYQLMLGDLDGWFDAVEKIYQLRGKQGLAYRPTFRREGIDNFMLAEE